jgi:phosphate transport system protein
MQREMEKLKKKLLYLGSLVEDNLKAAIRSVANRDNLLASQVIQKDKLVDEMEVEVEEDCLKVLALYQPVAGDLRFIVAVLKINNDLERIGDQAANIATKVKSLGPGANANIPFNFDEMYENVQMMLRQSLDSLINMDTSVARAVCRNDDKVDEMKKVVREQVMAEISVHPDYAVVLMANLGVARNLERVADLATNIAEDVIYMTVGNIVRHHVTD